ncbi:MAG: flagellar basal body rod protein FlgC, partial [Rhodothermales bacterium]|nr:flagellar basal body rod protein FlgC [Rhodothermales bacterium]
MPNPSLTIFRTAARGLEAQRIAVGAATENIANATATRPDGTAVPIRRAVFEAEDGVAGRFRRFLGEASDRLRRTDPRHLTGTAARSRVGGERLGRLRPEEPGPLTEVQDVEAERLEYDPT